MTWEFHAIMLPLVFLTGSFAGSFANVCIYRIPWQKSVIWPPSCCPKCLEFIDPWDNVPIIGWLRLHGRCRSCGLSIAPRYPLIELLVALLFVGVYLVDVAATPGLFYAGVLPLVMARMVYHWVLVTLLVVATFIDYDYFIIPDEVTVTGMALGVLLGALAPQIRPEPATAATALEGLWVGVLGLLVGGLVIYGVRVFGWVVFRKEAMGFGDVTLVAMIGSFLGWQVVPLTLFLGALVGLVHAVGKAVNAVRKWWSGQKLTGADHEIPFGPYLSIAAVILLLSWPWLWSGWAEELYATLGELFWFFKELAFGGPGGAELDPDWLN